MTQVISQRLGTGTVISQDDANVTVDFNGTEKTLVIRYAKLTYEDGTPFGEHAVAKEKKPMSARKRREKLQVTSGGGFCKNADGTTNWDAVNDFEEKRKRAAWGSISW